MPEGPAEKRARVLGAGPKRKRPTDEMTAQMRSYGKATRRKRLGPEVRAIADKIAEIKKLEESVRLVEVMKADRNRPRAAAAQRVRHATAELAAAEANLQAIEAAGAVDMSDLDKRQENLLRIISRHQSELEAMYKKAVDTSAQEPS